MSPDTDWRKKLDHGCQGLRSWSTYMKPSHEYRHAHQVQHDIFFHPMDAIRHKRDISTAWTTFVLDKSDSFTQAGVTRLNDSTRSYWPQARNKRVGTSTGSKRQEKSPLRPGLFRGGHRVLRRMLRKSPILRRNMQRSCARKRCNMKMQGPIKKKN